MTVRERLLAWGPARRLASGPQLNHLVRLAPVLELVRAVDGRTLLDAGSGSRGIAPWLPGWEVTAADVSFDDYGAADGPRRGAARAVVADVRQLPFPDASFDVVIALDLLEHVAPGDRAQALDELSRVGRRRVVVACPTGPAALEADRQLSADLRDPPGWLAEHLENGFPEAEEVAGHLRAHGSVDCRPNEGIAAHQRLVRAELRLVTALPLRLVAWVLAWALRAGGLRGRVAGRALAVLRGRDRLPAYRSIVSLEPRPEKSA